MAFEILFDCERMKYPHTGLYHFCKQLSKALISTHPGNQYSLTFYVPPAEDNFLGSQYRYMIQKSSHKFLRPKTARFDLWHSTYQGSNYYPVNKHVKKILTIHDLNFLHDETKSPAKKKQYLGKVQRMIDRSDYLSVISSYTLQCLQENLNIVGKPVEIIYNGCNKPDAAAVFQKPLFITSATPYIFSIGTITRKKNFHTLPSLLVGNDFNLVIAGITQDREYLSAIVKQAEKLGVANRLILPGAISENEKWWLLENMLAFAFPSIAEGFGLPVIEAMYTGKPVLLSTHTCLPETGGDAAYYFPSFEAEAMQQTLNHALQHYQQNPQQAQKIKNRAAFFSWDASAKKYWDLYAKLLNNS